MSSAAPVVVGVDGSSTSMAAMERATEVAAGLDAPVHIVGVDSGADSSGIDRALDEARQRAADRFPDLEVFTEKMATTRIGLALSNHAARVGAQLLVVGNLRGRGLRRLMGSVPDELALDAPCDLMIVKTT